MILIYSQ